MTKQEIILKELSKIENRINDLPRGKMDLETVQKCYSIATNIQSLLDKREWEIRDDADAELEKEWAKMQEEMAEQEKKWAEQEKKFREEMKEWEEWKRTS